jgi:carbamoyltransferase
VTADGGGDNVHYSHRHFSAGKLTSLYGGDDMILKPAEEDSLGKMYGWATKALGFRRVRHEGKVTGLVAMGTPMRADELMGPLSRRRPGTRTFESWRRSRDLCVHARAEARTQPRRLCGHRAAGA